MRTPRSLLSAFVALLVALTSREVGAQTPRPRPPPASPANEFFTYTVRQGDTCASIARRLYRDPRWTTLVHAHNALGRPPHRLTPGATLRLPRRAPGQRAAPPDAVLTSAHNRVEVLAPTPRPAHMNDPLFRGHRVSTRERSTAEVTFGDETQLRLQEQTLVVILGSTSAASRRTGRVLDTTLVSGALRASLGALAGRREPSLPIRTTAARVTLGAGEVELRVEPGRGTTLAVYRGRARIRTRRQNVIVSEGFAVRAEEGPTPAPLVPRALPSATAWSSTPPSVVFSEGTAALAWSFRPGEGPAPSGWRLELSRDEWFLELVEAPRLALGETTLERRELAPGRYHARVRALDAEGFEGPFGPVAVTAVVRPVIARSARAHRGSLELPRGLHCGLDGAPLVPTGEALELDRLAAHTLRCALTPDGAGAAETTLPAERLGPLTLIARLSSSDPVARRGEVELRVVDREGEPVAGRALSVTALARGARAEAPRVLGEPGVYSVPVAWPRGARTLSLRVSVDGREEAETRALGLPGAPAPRPSPSGPTALQRLSLRVEGGAGAVVSDYQRNADSQRYEGNVRGFDLALQGSVRVGLDVARPLALQLSATSAVFPSDVVSAGRSAAYTAGVRLTPWRGRVGGLFVEGNAGLALTGPYARFTFDAGVGFGFALSRAVSLGPVVRYTQVLQPDDEDFPDDARYWTAGAVLGFQLPSGEPPR